MNNGHLCDHYIGTLASLEMAILDASQDMTTSARSRLLIVQL